MAIGYDNEAGCCLANPDIADGHWYHDKDGALFIVPKDGEIEGPDGLAIDALNTLYRSTDFGEVVQEEVAAVLGLTVAYPWQHRFDQTIGYYTV